MIDLHYDLLTILYHCNKTKNYGYIKKIQEDIVSSGIKGLIANLYFKSAKEMIDEFGDYYTNIDVVEMFSEATKLYKKYFPNLPVIFSIEGCDYIGLSQLEDLYKLGLRNILLVWNNKNCYGSGNRDVGGLTNEGKKFLTLAVDLGISIDLSHMNEVTFADTVKFLKKLKNEGKKVMVIVSHSNCYDVYQNKRNLTDEQFLSLKGLDPLIGIVAYQPFVGENELVMEKYLKHIVHLKSLLGLRAIGLSTDDMTFEGDLFEDKKNLGLFDYKEISERIKKVLKNNFNSEEIVKIMYQNSFDKLFRRMKK